MVEGNTLWSEVIENKITHTLNYILIFLVLFLLILFLENFSLLIIIGSIPFFILGFSFLREWLKIRREYIVTNNRIIKKTFNNVKNRLKEEISIEMIDVQKIAEIKRFKYVKIKFFNKGSEKQPVLEFNRLRTYKDLNKILNNLRIFSKKTSRNSLIFRTIEFYKN